MAIKPKVLISDKMSKQAVRVFKSRGIEVTVKTDFSPDELKESINQYDGIAIRSSTKLSKELLNSSENSLKVIGRAGIGVDNIDITAATQNGIVVMNTPFGNSITTAEHAIAMMMSLSRKIPSANKSTHAGKWEKSKYMGQEIFGKTLGIIGCGNIGAIVADRAIGLKMKVIAFDPFLSSERAIEFGVEKLEFDELLKRSDFITIHTPLTEGTKGVINAKAMSKMKKGVMLINCARGGLIIEEDLKSALDSGQVAGAALDVYEVEPAKENILFGYDNVICTPHLGASTTEAQENVALQVAEQMSDFLLQGAVSNAINMPSVSGEDAPKLKPYMQLAEYLGSFAGQLVTKAPSAIKIEYEGHVSSLNIKPLTAIIVASFLKPSMAGVNIVSATTKAKERGISISETTRDRIDNYKTLIRVTIETEKESTFISGTIFVRNPRITNINGVPTESVISENMLYIQNLDKPGLIGNLGTILGKNNINIADFNLGRIQGKNKAIALVSVDEPINKDIIKEISKLEQVEDVKALRF